MLSLIYSAKSQLSSLLGQDTEPQIAPEGALSGRKTVSIHSECEKNPAESEYE